MKEKAIYPKNKNNKIDLFLAFRRKAKKHERNVSLQKPRMQISTFAHLFFRCLLAYSNLVTLNEESLTSYVVNLALIFAKILTSVPYNC